MSRRLAWQDDALCAQTDINVFFPEERGGSTKAARAICDICPVAKQCLEYALSMPDNPPGIWGNTSVEERRVLRRERAA